MNHSTSQTLDHPVWSALTTRQAHLRQGDQLVRRYHPEVAPFAALASPTLAAWQALYGLLSPHEQVALLTLDAVDPIDALRAERIGVIHQMVATRQVDAAGEDQDVIRLTERDAQDMLDLAQKAKPGPFGKRTREMGNYIGIRDEGRLIAMAGERMQPDGCVEISAVCVEASYRGKGLAGRLVKILRREIEQRGETPFLHVLNDNHAAIALYERLGFELRQVFQLTRVGRADAHAT